ncbi:MAG TPA: LysM peptidoglycan-binding domain-containing protein [Anaerolineales bacterium]|nr:LysM peptidoglycan-binding domain-containing protein [Anaerolineales bacterium]
MLNRKPPNPSNLLNSYKKRNQRGPFLVYGAVALVVIGIIMLIVWLASPGKPLGAMFATDTPTATLTFTPTTTSTPTLTPTETATPTVTMTSTPSEPFPYVIQEGDSLDAIAQRYNLGPDGVLLIYYQNQEAMEANNGVIFVGQTITIPPPGSVLPTTTPVPADLPSGRLIEYRVLPGDTLAGIAVKFNSITENIMEENAIEDANALAVGQVLQIPVNLVTPTATLPSTSTPVTLTAAAGQAATQAATSTSASGTTAQCDFEENAAYVTQLQTLINDERTGSSLTALSTNTQLAAAAKNHAVDMLCNHYFSDIGLDKSTPEERVSRAGFTASEVAEFIYASPNATPQTAFDWWMSNPQNSEDLLQADSTVIGVAYVTSDESLFGGYFVVITAKP